MIVQVDPGGKDFRRQANRHASDIRSTPPRGRPFDRDSSLVAEWPRSPAQQAGPTEIRDFTRIEMAPGV